MERIALSLLALGLTGGIPSVGAQTPLPGLALSTQRSDVVLPQGEETVLEAALLPWNCIRLPAQVDEPRTHPPERIFLFCSHSAC